MKKKYEFAIKNFAMNDFTDENKVKEILEKEIRIPQYVSFKRKLFYMSDRESRNTYFKKEILNEHIKKCKQKKNLYGNIKKELDEGTILSYCTTEIKEMIKLEINYKMKLLSRTVKFDKEKLSELGVVNTIKRESYDESKYHVISKDVDEICETLEQELQLELQKLQDSKEENKKGKKERDMEKKQDEINEKLEIVPDMEPLIMALEDNNFVVNNCSLFYRTATSLKKISNFIPILTKKIRYINDIDETVKYEITALLLTENRFLPEIIITKEELNRFNFIIGSNWDTDAIVTGNNERKLREVAQISAMKTIKEEIIYTHTGLTQINNKCFFLYHGGAIGENKGVYADLSDDGLEQYCFTDKEFNEKTALKDVKRLFELAPFDICAPLISFVFFTPLTSLLQQNGILSNLAIFLQGKTGTRKSSLAAVMLSCFGTFNRNNFVTTFQDTTNNLEKKAYILKDVPIVVDDLDTEMGNDKLDKVKKLTAMYGDRSGKGRMSPNGTSLKKAYNARGSLLITGEVIPNLEASRLARLIVIEIEENTVNLETLTYFQENGEKLAFGMVLYIKWIIKNMNYIIELCQKIMKESREKQDNSNHGRVNDSIHCLKIGFNVFTEFLKNYEIIDDKEKQQLLSDFNNCLEELIQYQNKNILSEKDPIEMFYNAIEEMIAIERIYLLDRNTSLPINNKEKGTLVGYIDNEYYYLFPNTIYSEILNFYGKTRTPFSLNKSTLLKMLQQQGLLYMTDKSRKTVNIIDKDSKEQKKVIKVKRI